MTVNGRLYTAVLQPRKKHIGMIGRRYGRLTVKICLGIFRGLLFWECQCDCGEKKEIPTGELPSRNECCACAKRKGGNLRHGMSSKRKSTPEYGAWLSMKDRCLNQKNINYKNYGGHGRIVCDGFINSPEAFVAAVGLRPSQEHSIDRINNEGHYSCGKCDQCIAAARPMNIRWATRLEQSRNSRTNVWLTLNGETSCALDWSRKTGIPDYTIVRRKRRGWTDERTLTEPAIHAQRRRQ